MNKNYFITLGIGILILLMIGVITSPMKNKITGFAPIAGNNPVTYTVGTYNAETGKYNLLDATGKSVNINLYDPANLLIPGKKITYLTDTKIVVDELTYNVRSQGRTWTELNENNNEVQKYTREENGVKIENFVEKTTTFNDATGNFIATVPSSMVGNLAINDDGKLVTLDEKDISVTSWQQGQNKLVIYNKDRTIDSILAQAGSFGYFKCNGEGNDCNLIDSQGVPVDVPRSDLNNIFVGDRGTILIKSEDDTKSTIFNTNDGSVTTNKYEGVKLTSSTTKYPGGSIEQAEVNGNGEIDYSTRYDSDGAITKIVIHENIGGVVDPVGKVYTVSPDGQTFYDCGGCTVQKVTNKKTGKEELVFKNQNDEIIPKPTDELTKDQLKTKITDKDIAEKIESQISWNNFMQGRAKAAYLGFGLGDVGRFATEVSQTYQALSGLNYWIDKQGTSDWNKRREEVEAQFAARGLGIDAKIAQICRVWTIQTNAPSTYAGGRDGLPIAHIEGRVYETADYNASLSTPEKTYAYIVTLAFTPSSIVSSSVKSDELLTVKLYLQGAEGRTPLKINKNEDSDVIKVSAGSAEVRYDGSNAIVKNKRSLWQYVCLDFSESADKLAPFFKGQLSNYALCNAFVKQETELAGHLGGLGESILAVAGIDPNPSEESSNQDNAQNQPADASVPPTTSYDGAVEN